MRAILISLISTILASFRSRLALQAEIFALRHQINVLRRSVPSRPRLRASDRFLWIWLLRLWPGWRSALVIVKPETIIAWHRKGFRLFWSWKSKRDPLGRPKISKDIRDLIRTLSTANVLWGAPRIHVELLKLGIEISQATVAKYVVRPPKPPSQTWGTFLNNHTKQLASIDFFTVPTITFRVLYVFVVLSHERRRVIHFNVTSHPTAAWTSQQLLQAFPFNTAPRYLLRDRDRIYSLGVRQQLIDMGITEVLTAPLSPSTPMWSAGLAPSGENVSTTSLRLTKNRFGQRCDPIFLTTTRAAAILHWTRIRHIREECSHLKGAWLLRSPKWAAFIIDTNDAQPDYPLSISCQMVPCSG
jgi:hypothetical protein